MLLEKCAFPSKSCLESPKKASFRSVVRIRALRLKFLDPAFRVKLEIYISQLEKYAFLSKSCLESPKKASVARIRVLNFKIKDPAFKMPF